jgi:hypothetical protein
MANDGSLTTNISITDGAPGKCNTGTDTMTPWWRVDFGYTASIGGGTIWGRTDCCLDRLNGFQIWVGNSGSAFNAIGNTNCYTATTIEHQWSPYLHSFDCAANGRYLFVVLTNGQCLAMREIEIYPAGEHSYYYSFLSQAVKDHIAK